jgi:hypothetical protein
VRRRAALLLAALLLAVAGACSSDQDPGLTPEGSVDDGPATTSHLLPACDTSPDASVPVGGCVASDGSIVNPDATN